MERIFFVDFITLTAEQYNGEEPWNEIIDSEIFIDDFEGYTDDEAYACVMDAFYEMWDDVVTTKLTAKDGTTFDGAEISTKHNSIRVFGLNENGEKELVSVTVIVGLREKDVKTEWGYETIDIPDWEQYVNPYNDTTGE